MIVLAAVATIPSEHWPAALKIATELRSVSVNDRGCISYDFYQSPIDPSQVLWFEEWESMEALQEHLQAKHTSDFFAFMNSLPGFGTKIKIFESDGARPL